MSSAPAISALDELRAVVSRLDCQPIESSGTSSFEIDGVLPSCVVAPRSESAVAGILAEARNRGLAVIPAGGRCHVHLGNVPLRYDVALSTNALTSTLEHEPDDLTATVDAGVRMGDLAAVLASRGQWLPIDAPDAATVGGVIAAGIFGPLRHAYGTLRDWVIGMRVAHTDGSVSKSGGRVVKNVAGYDMHKLHIGALGTLGVITQVTFKLATVPRATATIRASFSGAKAACAYVLAARDRGLPLIIGEVTAGDGRWLAVVRAAGSHGAVERSMRELQALAGEHGAAGCGVSDEPPSAAPGNRDEGRALELRAGVLPTQTAEVVEAMVDLDGTMSVDATVCAGVIRCAADMDAPAAGELVQGVTEMVRSVNGSVLVERADPELKRQIDVFGTPRADWEIMRRLKREFDPTGTLSAGRFAGRL